MIEYVIIIFLVLFIIGIFWIIQPYRNWKKNFDARQYQPISITNVNGQKCNLEEYKNKKSSQQVQLSLVVPSYNQSERLPIMLEDSAAHLKKSKLKYEIIIVNDGSKDNTTEVALKKGKELKVNLIVVEYPTNRGKGGAVRAGMAAAFGKYVLMVDADGATTFSEIDKVLSRLKQIEIKNNNPLVMVVGSRRHLQQEAKVERKWHRKIVSAVFKIIISFLLDIKTKDTQCGFKLFTLESSKILFKTLHIQRFAFDVQLFYLCNKFKIQTDEVAVQWRDVDGSKLNVIDASINMFRDVLMIRIYYLIGLWKTTDKVQVQ